MAHALRGSLRVAIAGAGLMGYWHARYAGRGGASICGVADPDEEAANRLASQFPGVRRFSETQKMLEETRPQVVHVCSSLESHAQIAGAAIDSGAHVLVEKPLAGDAGATRDLLSQADKTARLLAPVHQFAFQKGFRKAQRTASQMGRVLSIDAVFCSAGGELKKTSADGIAADILPHPLSLIERLRPNVLPLLEWDVHRPLDGEWRIFSSGQALSVSIFVSLQTRPTEASLRIGTEAGVIDVDLFHGFATVDAAPVSKVAKVTRPFRRSAKQFAAASWNLTQRLASREFAYPGLRELIAEFYEAVRKGDVSPISPAETLAVAMTRDRILQAAAAEEQKRGMC